MSKRPRVEMVPLIDMFFLLLIFFIFGVFSMKMQEGI
ncbi:MAG: biopolymer transporter ExbD, partial [Candidatus Omnitrophica bacterium]|nr:biopolymer transporter ExbD [Candidatus Omnitrophota bacterium]